MPSVVIDGVEYVPKDTILKPERLHVDERLYDVLEQLRTDIGNFRDHMMSIVLHKDIDELDRMWAMTNRAIGILIGTSG